PPTAAVVPEMPVIAPASSRFRVLGSNAGAVADAIATTSTRMPTSRAIRSGLDTATTQTPTGVSASRADSTVTRCRPLTSRQLPTGRRAGRPKPHPSTAPGIRPGPSHTTNGAATTTTPNPTLPWTSAPTSTAVPSTSTRPTVGSGTAPT